MNRNPDLAHRTDWKHRYARPDLPADAPYRRCPDCGGRGAVPDLVFDPEAREMRRTRRPARYCRDCAGEGIVWLTEGGTPT